jgi:hypothetical protein
MCPTDCYVSKSASCRVAVPRAQMTMAARRSRRSRGPRATTSRTQAAIEAAKMAGSGAFTRSSLSRSSDISNGGISEGQPVAFRKSAASTAQQVGMATSSASRAADTRGVGMAILPGPFSVMAAASCGKTRLPGSTPRRGLPGAGSRPRALDLPHQRLACEIFHRKIRRTEGWVDRRAIRRATQQQTAGGSASPNSRLLS